MSRRLPVRSPVACTAGLAHAPADAVRRAVGAAVAYGRVARAVRASPYTLTHVVRAAVAAVPAVDDAARRACVWAALGAYFGGPRPARDRERRTSDRVGTRTGLRTGLGDISPSCNDPRRGSALTRT